ncbi:2-oxo-4-hydroxy-4-carboxy-5-ureidoimidazoline decarboxylase [Meiothermus rufus]|uniref:2-oxo-4-hydroxy-4-carboxy-5-ureidoimidazoline decarboxylase n=1 Tax=Meiothermus rufus TaxID=604332 RepID=UPI000403CD3F|nr:2-oxo-4-hydroxy-4-carboxy-5-ureidoimidazoline decarboxylase [Meiothermus rufus]
MINLATLNQLSREAFVNAIGWVFEHSPWVAEQAWAQRPWSSPLALYQSLVAVVQAAPREAQLALIRAHPDLGSKARMAPASAQEQQGAGLDALSPEEYADLLALNQRYRERFGFPFILAVRGKGKAEVFQALRDRLHNDLEAEFHTALEQIYQIARFRLADILQEAI